MGQELGAGPALLEKAMFAGEECKGLKPLPFPGQ